MYVKIKPLDILVWTVRPIEKKTDKYAKIVSIFTLSQYVHTGIVVRDADNQLKIWEAIPPRVRLASLTDRLPFYLIRTNYDWKDTYLEYVYGTLGEKYGFLEAILSYFGQYKDNNKWICVELITKFIQKHIEDIPDLYTPRDMVKYFIEKKGYVLSYPSSIRL